MRYRLNLNLLLFSIISMILLLGCSQKRYTHRAVGATKYTSTARHKATLKPYIVKGKRYIPTLVKRGSKQYGISSWYGPNFHGKYTSNGEIYNMHARTAAHKTFPMDTIVRVRNLENGRSTIVRINDRGPFVAGRIIDCSYKAGREIGLDKSGIAKVEVTVLGVANKADTYDSTTKKHFGALNHKQAKEVIRYKQYTTPKQYRSSTLLGIQLGAYRHLNGAVACSRKYQHHYVKYRPLIKKSVDREGVTLYRVWLVGFKNNRELLAFKQTQRNMNKRL